MIFNKKIVGCCLICILLIVTVFQFTGCASKEEIEELENCLLYTSPSPRD